MRFIVLTFFALIISQAVFSQKASYWNDIEKSTIPDEIMDQRTLSPDAYRSIKIDFKELSSLLSEAPMERSGKKHISGIQLELPYPDGRSISYLLVESPNMEAGISARYPMIKSYYGYNKKEPYRTVRLVLSPLGFHAVCSGPEGQVYIDPFLIREKEYVQSYFVKDHLPDGHMGLELGCGTVSELIKENSMGFDVDESNTELKTVEPVVERKYRLAIAATGEWTTQLYNGSVTDGLAAMNISAARINSIFERDFASRVVLIDREDELIHTSPATDPYINANVGGSLLGQNTDAINSIINIGDYDYGHIYTANCSDVGGIANLGSVCGGNKGAGVTCHYSSNLDFVTVSIACHEMGHQFSANHTFNNCGGNINPATSFEPGSGSTIMSYCGLCGDQNIQNRADDYYHVGSLFEIYNFIELGNGNSCPQKTTTDNNRPEVEFPYEDDFYIPISTPFYLEANGSDVDDDQLFYSFEQYNTGPISDLGTPIGGAPMFRVLYPNEENFRYFPKLSTVVSNGSDIREVLPTYSREITFRAVVRDYNPAVGASNWDEVEFAATDEAGPFLVMSPNAPMDIEAGSTFEVTWDVANTDGELVDCKFVNILLSTDGGYNYPITLVESVYNDGAHQVVIPDILTNNARIKIEAVGNIFYDMSNTDFNIIAPVEPAYNFVAAPFFQQYCLPSMNSIEVSSISVLDYDSPVSFSVSGLPNGGIANLSSSTILPGENLTIDFDLNGVDTTGLITVEILGVSESGDSISQQIQMDLYSNNFSAIELTLPAQSAQGVIEAPNFAWEPSPNAQTYNIEIANSPSFEPETILSFANGLTEPAFRPTILLGKNIPLYWRISANNICGQGPWTSINVFHTETLSCDISEEAGLNIIIPASPSELEHTVTFFEDGTINDFNVANIEILYSPVVYLELSLTGPLGDEVTLMNGVCGGTSSVNIGFDSEAPTEIPCPANDGIPHQPLDDLSIFNGQNVKGDWTLKVKTNGDAFDPGRIKNIALEVCSNVSQSGPQLINNIDLPVRTNDGQVIEPLHLLAEDANNGPGELIYTLMEGLQHGSLMLNGEALVPGGQYTQVNINQFALAYFHNGDDATEDEFFFNVTDGEGGFIGKTRFSVSIDDNNPALGIGNVALKDVLLFPNPADQTVTIEFAQVAEHDGMLNIFDLQGKLLASQLIVSGSRKEIVNTSSLASGVYFVQWLSKEGLHANEKLIIQR